MLFKGNASKSTHWSVVMYASLTTVCPTFLQMGKDIKVFSVDSAEHDTEITVTLI
jgi:hypothetical protein